MTKEKRSFQHMVVDAGPLIANAFPASLSERFYTVPEVLGEIKDAATRDRLARLPFELEVKSPSAEALKTVREFARATGDAASLSMVDLKVVALTLTLEREANGDKSRVRTTSAPILVHEGAPSTKGDRRPTKSAPPSSVTSQPAEAQASAPNPTAEAAAPNIAAATAAAVGEEEEDAGEWITPDNIATVRAKAAAAGHRESKADAAIEAALQSVGCISTDFAVQNLLLQMRLKAYGPEGYRIRQVKNWLLRCHACYWTTKQMDRQFCDKCGNATLLRTSYAVDSAGDTHLFLKKDFRYNLRGTVAPLPAPKPGRDGNRILLREDQKEYQQARKTWKRAERKSEKASDLAAIDDRLASIFGGMSIKGASDSFDVTPPTIGFGRRNPNQARRRI